MALIWGSSFLFVELSLEFTTALGVAFWRTALGGLAMLGLLLVTKARLPQRPMEWFHLWVAGLFMSAIPFSLFSFAQQSTTSVLAAIIGAATPMFALLAMLTIFRVERSSGIAITGLIVGLIGVLITLGAWQGFGDNDPLAIAALVLAALSYGIGTPYLRKYVTPLGLSGTATAAVQVGSSAITLLPFYLLTGPLFTAVPATQNLLALIALGVLGSGYAYRLYHGVIAKAGSAVATMVTYTNPVIASIWGVLLLSEPLHWYEPVGGVIVIAGAYLTQYRPRQVVLKN